MDCEFEELYKWVEEHPITRPKRNINRDFSDAIPLAEILKHHFPKLVQLHNYSPKNSHAQKVVNWQTLNDKVLKKLHLGVTTVKMEQLAKGEPGVIEKLLQSVKKKIEKKSSGDDNSDVVYLDTGRTSPHQENTNKRTIPVAVFSKMEADLAEKNEAIQILKNKVEHLEKLLDLKEERIKDLTKQLQSVVNEPQKLETASGSESGSRFFRMF